VRQGRGGGGGSIDRAPPPLRWISGCADVFDVVRRNVDLDEWFLPSNHEEGVRRWLARKEPPQLACLNVQRQVVVDPFVPEGRFDPPNTAYTYYRTTGKLDTGFWKTWCSPKLTAASWVHWSLDKDMAKSFVIIDAAEATFRHMVQYNNNRPDMKDTENLPPQPISEALAARLRHTFQQRNRALGALLAASINGSWASYCSVNENRCKPSTIAELEGSIN
jgi:hypothetical protein